jgi:hypothetical protein
MPPGMALPSGGGALGGHGADDFAFPQVVLWGQLAEAALDTGQHVGGATGSRRLSRTRFGPEPLASFQNDDRPIDDGAARSTWALAPAPPSAASFRRAGPVQPASTRRRCGRHAGISEDLIPHGAGRRILYITCG